jgi:4'-phosphopantetheinyl transferase EntD
MASRHSWRALCPESVLVARHRGVVLAAVGARSSGPATLQPAELAVQATRPPARRADFALGRRAAALGLARLGVAGPVLRDPSGVPLFPVPVRGSLAHRDGIGVCAAVADARSAVGVDLELTGLLRPDDGRHLYAPGERSWVLAGGTRADERVTAVFAAKEAVFKAWYAATRGPLQFPDIALAPRRDGFDCAAPQCVVRVRKWGRYVLSWVRLAECPA